MGIHTIATNVIKIIFLTFVVELIIVILKKIPILKKLVQMEKKMKNVKNKTARSLENVHTGDCLTNRLVYLDLFTQTC